MKKSVLAFALVLAALPATASAEDIYCGGTITSITVGSTGIVWVNPTYRNDYLQFCNINSVWNNIDPAVCVAWLSLLQSAKKDGAPVLVYYNVSSGTSCANLATYASSPPPGYVMRQ